jgi:hypothetical protein
MKTNKLDKNIKEKFSNRAIEPSISAWERLSTKLDEQPQQKKRGWFFYIGAAASILLLISIGFQMFSDDSVKIIPKNEVVTIPIDTNTIDKRIDKFINEIPVEKALVKVDGIEEKQVGVLKNTKHVVPTKEEPLKREVIRNRFVKEEKIIIAKVEENLNAIPTKEAFKIKEPFKQNSNSSIKINSDDLLYAVTHSSKEVKTYYAKCTINKEDVLKIIKKSLKKSNVKVDPNIILAEVELTIDEDDFQNNFMKSLKRKVSDFAIAVAGRND